MCGDLWPITKHMCMGDHIVHVQSLVGPSPSTREAHLVYVWGLVAHHQAHVHGDYILHAQGLVGPSPSTCEAHPRALWGPSPSTRGAHLVYAKDLWPITKHMCMVTTYYMPRALWGPSPSTREAHSKGPVAHHQALAGPHIAHAQSLVGPITQHT